MKIYFLCTGMKIIAYFFFLYIVIIVFSCLGYDYYGRSSNRGMPLATISDIFYCLWVISFVGAIGYIRYVGRGVKNQPGISASRRRRGPRR